MKRKFTLLLAALLCLAGMNAWALDQKDGVYQIASGADMAAFANVVNTQNRFANAVLTADIDYTENFVQITPSTSSSAYRDYFAGVFDGQGHKITVKIEGTDTNASASLFGGNSGLIKNLVIDGEITVNAKYGGAIVALNCGTVTDCVCLVNFTTKLDGDNTAGGILGAGYNNGQVDRCVFAGTVKSDAGVDATCWGGISGWLNKMSAAGCLNIGTFDVNLADGNSFPIIRANDSNNVPGRIRNNLYADTWTGPYENPDSKAITAEQIKNGYAAYVLGMGQLIGTDDYPSPLSTARVYAKGSCDPDLAAGFTNDPALAAKHTGDGPVCSTCGMLKADYVETDADGYYLIGNAAQLDWFASMVNKGGVAINGKLTADIDMSSLSNFQIIGNDSTIYCGTFDGQYHKISNMNIGRPNINKPGSINVGLFGSIGAQAKIKHMILDETCSVMGYQHVGGLIGHSTQAGSWDEVEGIISYATVTAYPVNDGGSSDAGVGGIVGNYNDVTYGKMTNCAFLGQVSGTSCAHLSGWYGNTQSSGCPPDAGHTYQYTVTGCWSVADKPVETALNMCFGRASGSGTCVQLNYCAAINSEQAVTVIKPEDVAGGGLAWAVTDPENPGWFQKLGTDPMPTLQGTDIVYKNGTKNCDGSEGEGFGYSNENKGFTQLPHQVDPNTGLCTICGQWVPAEDGWYEIGSVETFLRFAELTKTDANVKARLTANLDFSGVADDWAPIGGTKTFTGEFDGQGHVISNMILNQPTRSDFGMFKTGANVVLKNFIVDSSCSITGAQKVGLIGNHSGGGALFENIGNMANVDGEGENVSGFFGGGWSASVPVTINSCWVVGEITTGNREEAKNPTNCGAFGGWLNSGTFIFNNCWTIARVPNSGNYGRYFTRHNDSYPPQLNNCYSLFGTQVNPIPGFEEAVDAADEAARIEFRQRVLEELATGGLTYKLNGDQSTITWFQTLGVDACPVPWSDHGTVYGLGAVRCDGKPLGGAMNYSNNKEDAPPVPDHQFNHGFCENCGTFDPTYKQPVNDYYELGDAEDILWFATLVENGNANANARLTADIDMTDVNEKYKPFGTRTIYAGTFDGDYHRISNLYIDGHDGDNIGFISQVRTGATLKNIIFDASCTIIGGTYVGIIGGSPSSETGEIYMTNVGNEGTVTATVGANAGAIIGCNHGSAALYQLSGCYSTGTISGVKENGALSGWIGSKGGSITKCWSTATVTEYQSEDRYLFRYGSTAPTMSQIYATQGEQGTIVTDAQMASGEVTFALNNSSFLDPVWYQTIGEDLLPTFVPGHGVVYNVNGEMGDVHDSDSYFTLRTLMIGSETEFAESTIATQALLDAYLATVESWGTIETFEDFCIAYRESQKQRDAIKTSVAAYKEYIDACEYAINYLKENDFTNDSRTKLEAYLDQNEGPSDEYPNGTYLYVVEKHELTDDEITNETAFLNIMLNKAITGGEVMPGTELTVTLANYDFKDGFNGWTVESSNGGMATGGEKTILTVARGLNTNFTVEQTLEEMPNGIYELRVNGFETTADDIYSQLHTSQLFLNGNANFMMTVGEGAISKDEAEDGVNCHLTGSSIDVDYVYGDFEGYVPDYMVGCSYAFKAGRYLNYTAVEVKDGKLTLGVRNMGSGLKNDWTPFANVRLFYLGNAEQASESLDNVLDGYVARAEVIRDFEWVDTEEAAQYPNMSEALKEQIVQLIEERAGVTTGEQKMDLINRFSALFNEVYACRKAYVEMVKTADEISDNATRLNEFALIEQNDLDEVLVIYNKAWEAYQDGSVSAEEAKAIVAELRAFDFAPAKDENGVYQLNDGRDLGIFALLVNGGQYNADAVLTADIDMTGINYTPIGWNMATDNSSANTTGALYCGHFDGQGHRISNLLVDKPGSIGSGMFGDIISPAHIENFVLDSSCEIRGIDRAGVVGRADGTGRSGDERIITINNVGNEGKVLSDKAAAGILGNANNGSLAIIRDCYSTGLITTYAATPGTNDLNHALICGWLANLGAQITNCWSTAEITNYTSVDKALCRVGGDNNIFKNNYSTFASQAKIVTPEAFTTGEVTYGLNGGATENVTWFQTIGEDAHPVFAGEGHLIVSKKADGTYYNLEDAIRNISFEVGNVVSVFDAQGRMVRSNVSPSKALQGMTKGMYILKGESKSMKVLVK